MHECDLRLQSVNKSEISVDPPCDISEEDIQPCDLTKVIVTLHTVVLIKRSIPRIVSIALASGWGSRELASGWGSRELAWETGRVG